MEMNSSWTFLFSGLKGLTWLGSAVRLVPTLREDGVDWGWPELRVSFPGNYCACCQKEVGCVQESSEVKAIGTGPDGS